MEESGDDEITKEEKLAETAPEPESDRGKRTVVDGRVRHMHGWRKDRPDHRDLLYKVSNPSLLKNLPEEVDLRHWLPRTEQQNWLGSCTSHASTSSVEYLYRKHLGREETQLSRLFLYYVTRVEIEGTDPAEDSGCQIRDVMKALRNFGVCLESNYPYDPAKYAEKPPDEAYKEALDHQIITYYRLPNLQYLKLCLAQGYPAVGGFSVPQNMSSDECSRTGHVKYPRPDEPFDGGHAVLFVGYRDSDQVLIFQNSWGTDWGNSGFGSLPFDFVVDGLADDFWTIRRSEM